MYKQLLAIAVITIVLCPVALAKPPGNPPANSSGNQGAQNNAPAQTPAGPSAAGSTPSQQATAASTASFESQFLAFRQLNDIAKRVAKVVCHQVLSQIETLDGTHPTDPELNENTILIYDQTAFANMQAYSAFVQNTNALIGAYQTLTPSGTPGGAQVKAAAGSGTSISWSPVSDLTGLLQAVAVSANNETYGTVAIPDSALAIALAREMRADDKCNQVPLVYPPIFGPGSASAPGDVQSTIDSLNAARKAAQKQITTPISTGTNGTNTSTSYFATALTDINGLYDNFMNSLLQPNPNTGVLGSSAVVQGKALSDLVHGNSTAHKQPAFILLATVLAAGGTVHDHKSFWTALGKGDEISYSGGAIVAVTLWQYPAKPGLYVPTPLYSDLIPARSDFEASGAITR